MDVVLDDVPFRAVQAESVTGSCLDLYGTSVEKSRLLKSEGLPPSACADLENGQLLIYVCSSRLRGGIRDWKPSGQPGWAMVMSNLWSQNCVRVRQAHSVVQHFRNHGVALHGSPAP